MPGRRKPFTWHGYAYTLSIERHWSTFFTYAAICHINHLSLDRILPEVAGYHFELYHAGVQAKRGDFDTHSNWWSFSCSACDHYCDWFVMRRPMRDNPFWEFLGDYRAQDRAIDALAGRSRGFIGTLPAFY